MLKILGSFLIILSTSGMGFLYAYGYKERVRQLRELQFTINALSSEILYSSNPLWIAFLNVANKCSSPFKELFLNMSDSLKEKSTETISDSFELALKQQRDNVYLDKEDLDLLRTFINGLSSNDCEGHKKNFNITQKKLEGLEKIAEENRNKNERLYKYLGVLSGLLIVILLV